MKNKISLGIASTFLLVTVAAFAANFTDDTLQIGKPGSSADKSVIFGASNKKKLTHKPSTQTLDYEGNNLSVGDGTNSNKVLKFNKGASSPEIRYNSTTGKLQFTNDTTTYKDIGSGSGGGGGGTNLLQERNADFETLSPPQDWTASGGTFIAETTDPLFGLQSGSWDSSASAQTLSSALVTIEKGFIGKKCTADIEYRWPSGVAGDLSFQVVDQVPNILATVALEPTTGSNTRKAFLAFDCPTVATDQLRVRLLSNVSNPAIIVVDNAFVGVNKSTTNVSQASVWANARWLPAVNCHWAGNGAAALTHFLEFTADTDCNNPTVGGQAVVPGTKVPRLRVSTVPPGKYMFVVKGGIFGTFSGTGEGLFAVTEGSTDGGVRMWANTTSTTSPGTMIGYFEVTSTQTNLEFRPIAQPAAGTWVAGINNSETTQNEHILTMELYRFPTESAEALNLETTGAIWSGKIYDTAGGNVDLLNVNLTDYTESIDPDLALELRSGSRPMQIACQTGNASTGLTCSSGSEAVGIAVDIDSAGTYKFCVEGSYLADYDNDSYAVFAQLMETPNNSSTILQQGGTTQGWSRAGAIPGSTIRPVSLCGMFMFASAGKKTIRLMREQSFTGAPNGHSWIVDRSATGGQRDLHFYGYQINQGFPAPVFTEVKNKINIGQSDIKKGLILVNFPGGVPTINKQFPGSWVSSLTDNGTGLTTVNFSGGYFSSVPICLVSLDSTTGSHIVKLNGVTSSTSTQVRSYDLAGTNTDLTFALECTGN